MSHSGENRFTEAEMETARGTDLPDLLASLGYQVKRIGSYHTTKEMDSIRIKNRRTWFRYSENMGGDAITFLQRFYNKSFPEAVEYLLAYHGRARDSPLPARTEAPPSKEENIPFALPTPNAEHRRVFAYLRKRGIAPQVIRDFLSAGLLYEDADHHNCVFVGRNSSGQPVFATKRGTYDRNGSGFKGDVPGSDKSVAFRMPCDPASDRVFVFEAPIDLMSYCTLHREIAGNAVALCCLHDDALATYLKEHPHLKRVILCLDNDQWGRAAAERIKAEYTQKGYTVTTETPAARIGTSTYNSESKIVKGGDSKKHSVKSSFRLANQQKMEESNVKRILIAMCALAVLAAAAVPALAAEAPESHYYPVIGLGGEQPPHQQGLPTVPLGRSQRHSHGRF